MTVETQVLAALLQHELLEDQAEMVRGIAQRGADQGFEALSERQQAVLQPFLRKACEGVEDPGGYHNECPAELDGEALVTALEQMQYYQAILCENCRDETERYQREWERLERE